MGKNIDKYMESYMTWNPSTDEFEAKTTLYDASTRNIPKFPSQLFKGKSTTPYYELVGYLEDGSPLYDTILSFPKNTRWNVLSDPAPLTKYLTALLENNIRKFHVYTI